MDLKRFARRLRPFLARERKLYALAAVFEALTLGTLLAYPQLLRLIIDEGIQGGSLERVDQLVLVMLGVLGVQAIATFLRSYLFELTAQRVSMAIRRWLFGNLLKQEAAFYDDASVGELSARLNSDVGRLAIMLKELVPELLHFLFMGLGAAALMIHTSPRLSLILVLVTPPIWGVSSVLGRAMHGMAAHGQARFAEVARTSLEALLGSQTVRGFRAEEHEERRYREVTGRWLSTVQRQAKAFSLHDSFTTLLSEGAVLAALWFGGRLIVGGSLTAGSLVTFILYAGLVMRSIRNVSRSATEAMRAQGATDRLFELGERESRMPLDGRFVPDVVEGSVTLEDVHFHYASRPDTPALRGVSLHVPPGEVVALVGASGSGKSTIAKLIARQYDPTRGRVLFDGRDLRDYEPGWLRRQITWVPAEAWLFACSVAENIAYGRPDAKPEEICEAARFANAAGFIEALPEGYATRVGDQGHLFSSGQRQRIAIARAVLVGARVLVLDEATAALDSEGEAQVKASLRRLPQRPTLLIVSHRLSTIVDADRVVLVQEGRLAASGSHAELLADSPAYRELIESQLLGE